MVTVKSYKFRADFTAILLCISSENSFPCHPACHQPEKVKTEAKNKVIYQTAKPRLSRIPRPRCCNPLSKRWLHNEEWSRYGDRSKDKSREYPWGLQPVVACNCQKNEGKYRANQVMSGPSCYAFCALFGAALMLECLKTPSGIYRIQRPTMQKLDDGILKTCLRSNPHRSKIKVAPIPMKMELIM